VETGTWVNGTTASFTEKIRGNAAHGSQTALSLAPRVIQPAGGYWRAPGPVSALGADEWARSRKKAPRVDLEDRSRDHAASGSQTKLHVHEPDPRRGARAQACGF